MIYVGHDKIEDLPKVIQTKEPLFVGLVNNELGQSLEGDVSFRAIIRLTCVQGIYLHYWNCPVWNYKVFNGKVQGDTYEDLTARCRGAQHIIENWIAAASPAQEVLPGIVLLPAECVIECFPGRIMELDVETKTFRVRA